MSVKPGSDSRVIHIVRGEPSDEELAALAAVLTVVANRVEPAAARSPWTDPAHRLRIAHHRSPDAWRISARLR